MNQPNSPLPDRIQVGVRILFVGINPGLRSAKLGHHFAGHSNRFWKLIYDSKLVMEPLSYQEDWRLPEWGIGLTNIISRATAGTNVLDPKEYRAGLRTLEKKIRHYQPRIVAILGLTIFRMAFSKGSTDSAPLTPGPTYRRLGGAPLFLLPNPSGRNARYSYPEMLEAFMLLRSTARSAGPIRKIPQRQVNP
ncbi:mismatch-specific DNA-glycosylase [Petrachloros mirabilis]